MTAERIAVAQIRVSTSKQAIYGTSYENQEQEIIRYCKQNNIELIKIFKENGDNPNNFKNASGAALLKREELLRSLDFVRKDSRINTFVFFKMDRFTRDIRDYVWFKEQLDQLKIRQVSVTEHFDDSTIEGESWMYMSAVLADKDRKDVIKKLSIGHVNRFRQGYFLSVPPIGYMKPDISSKICRPLVPDPERFPLLKMGFEMMLTGNYTLSEVRKWLNDQGLLTRSGRPISKQTLSRVFRSIRYTGYNEIKNKKSKFVNYNMERIKAEWYDHRMIEYEDWYELQKILDRAGDNRAKKPNRANPMFLLNKVIKCSVCGKHMSGYLQKGIPYYKCNNAHKVGKHDHFKASPIETILSDMLSQLTVSKEFLIGFERWMRVQIDTGMKSQQEMAKVYESQLCSIEAKKENVKAMAEASIYTVEQAKEKLKAYDDEYLNVKGKLDECFINDDDSNRVVENALYFLEHIGEAIHDLEPERRAKVLWLFFPEGLVWTGDFSNQIESPCLKYIWSIREDMSHVARQVGHYSNFVELLYKEFKFLEDFHTMVSFTH